MQREYGMLTPHHVVAEAKKKSSPLHQYFTWDTETAAYNFLLDQARDLIKEVRIEVGAQKVSKFTNVVIKHDDGSRTQGYMETVEVLSDDDLRQQVMERALAMIETWQQRYAEYDELARIINGRALSAVRSKVKPKRKVRA